MATTRSTRASFVMMDTDGSGLLPILRRTVIAVPVGAKLDTMSSPRDKSTRSIDTVSSSRPGGPSGDPATRQRILAAALQLISARGGADVTLAGGGRDGTGSRHTGCL